MEIVLYGAGVRGKKIEKMLYSNGITIRGFCDTNKTGYVECEDGRNYPILTVKEILRGGYGVIVTVGDYASRVEITDKLIKDKVVVVAIEDVLKSTGDAVIDNRNFIAEYHVNEMDDYFESAEEEESLLVFWGNDSVFHQMFNRLDTTDIVELACGRGRHVPHYVDQANHITLVDILDKNIEYCRERFKGIEKISYYKNNGYDLQELGSNACTSLFTYDAMVHFEMLDIFNYLKETRRILRDGGKALFHHSNNTENYKITFSTGTSGRNYMSSDLFAYLANRAGLKVIEQKIIDWGGTKNLDCLTLIEK